MSKDRHARAVYCHRCWGGQHSFTAHASGDTQSTFEQRVPPATLLLLSCPLTLSHASMSFIHTAAMQPAQQASSLSSSFDRMTGLVCGFIGSQIVRTLAQLAIPDILAKGPLTATELATSIKANEDATRRMLRGAVVLGLVTVDSEERFHSTELLSVLESDSPVSLRGWSIIMATKVTLQRTARVKYTIPHGTHHPRAQSGVLPTVVCCRERGCHGATWWSASRAASVRL